jgi:hypothetical protein
MRVFIRITNLSSGGARLARIERTIIRIEEWAAVTKNPSLVSSPRLFLFAGSGTIASFCHRED